MDASEGGGLIVFGDPMEGGVGEGGVELLVKGEFGGGGVMNVEVAGAGGTDLGGTDHGLGGVDAGEDGSGGGEPLGERAVATADVEDALAGLRGEEIDDAGSEVGDEAAILGVGGGVPGLGGCIGGAVIHILSVGSTGGCVEP